MESNQKNCANCKHYRVEEETILKRDGIQVEKIAYPSRCLNGKQDVMLKWKISKNQIELKCFEEEL